MESRRVRRWGWVLVGLLAVCGCAGVPRIAVPPDLPNTTREQFLVLRWALVRESGRVQAVGQAEPMSRDPWDAAIALEGLDAQGRVVSRGSGGIRPGFDSGPTPFQVELAPTGGETDFRLRVVRAQQFSRPSR